MAITSASLRERGDVAIGLSHTGTTVDTIDALREARRHGAVTVAVTNFPWSPITEAADFVLLTAARETAFRSGAMTSRIAQLTVVDCLFVTLAQQDLARTGVALERTFAAAQAKRAAVPAASPRVTSALASVLPGRLLGVDAGGSGTRVVLLADGQVTANAGHDPEAQRIVRCAAEHLATLAESIRRRLRPLPVAGAGGVFRAPAIWSRFAELTGASRPLASAAVGAALLAAACTERSPSASCSFHGNRASLSG